ncbi:MAG: hypothetical protein QOK35_2496 [Pseudonocardiales bacterium]|nr:hypothetical protein [Pseudonocardiales bacterium]
MDWNSASTTVFVLCVETSAVIDTVECRVRRRETRGPGVTQGCGRQPRRGSA